MVGTTSIRAPLVAVLLAVAGVGSGCRSAPASPRQPSVLLISIDTLRADHLGSYGDASAQTPRLDALAARGLRFAQATTVTPLTLPAHASLMTGLFPARHGVRDNGGFYLDDSQVTLAEVLKQRGYRTGGFVAAFVLDRRWGIAQGFDRFYDDFDLAKYGAAGMDAVQRRGDDVVDKALGWLREDRTTPFLGWVHLYDPHTPYEAPEPYRSRFPQTLIGAYDAEIAWTDSQVGRLLDELAAQGRLDDTLVVIVGDHGESLGEHAEQAHGFFVYDATVHIPLIVAGPGVPARTISEQVRIVDVMPTLLALAGAPAPAATQGQDLMPLAEGRSLGLIAFSETYYPRYHYGWSELSAVRDGRYKFIQAPRPELYDLRDDAGELRDRSHSDAARAGQLQQALAAMKARLAEGAAPFRPQAMDPETEQRLAALGYLGGGLSARQLEERPRGDPKDKIGIYNLLKLAAQASVEERLDDALARAREALRLDPATVEAHTLQGNFLLKAKRADEAVAAYKAALVLDPEHQGATWSLALAYKQLGRLREAEAGFERLRTLDPRATRATWQLAEIWMQQGRFDRAEPALRAGLAQGADKPAFLLKLGECLIETKRYAEAESALREALALRPALLGAHYNLALVREAQGDVAAAQAEYELELRAEPKAYRAGFNLGRLLLKSGRTAEAVARLEAAVEANPSFGTGQLYLAKGLLDQGDLAGAEAAARAGLAGAPEQAVAPLGHYVLADVYSRQGRADAAGRELAAARKLERGR